MPDSVENIQRRCRAVAERLEVLAGSPNDLIASADPHQGLFIEAASLLRGYHQCLLVESVLSRDARCEGCYPVPQTSPPRDEPFEVTYRCAKPNGHAGEHGPLE
jgi:hypothetical protein